MEDSVKEDLRNFRKALKAIYTSFFPFQEKDKPLIRVKFQHRGLSGELSCGFGTICRGHVSVQKRKLPFIIEGNNQGAFRFGISSWAGEKGGEMSHILVVPKGTVKQPEKWLIDDGNLKEKAQNFYKACGPFVDASSREEAINDLAETFPSEVVEMTLTACTLRYIYSSVEEAVREEALSRAREKLAELEMAPDQAGPARNHGPGRQKKASLATKVPFP